MGTGVGAAVAAGFTEGAGGASPPGDIPNNELWLRADQGTTLGGGGVNSWTGIGPNARVFNQVSDSSQPVAPAPLAALNNQQVIAFDGINDSLISTDVASVWNFLSNGGGATAVVIAQALNSSGTFFSTKNSSSGGLEMNYSTGAGGLVDMHMRINAGVNERRERLTGLGDPATMKLFTFYDDEDLSGTINGVATTTSLALGTTNSNAAHALTIGSLVGSSASLEGSIAEVIMYSRILTAEELSVLDAYILDRYSI